MQLNNDKKNTNNWPTKLITTKIYKNKKGNEKENKQDHNKRLYGGKEHKMKTNDVVKIKEKTKKKKMNEMWFPKANWRESKFFFPFLLVLSILKGMKMKKIKIKNLLKIEKSKNGILVFFLYSFWSYSRLKTNKMEWLILCSFWFYIQKLKWVEIEFFFYSTWIGNVGIDKIFLKT
jgi:hypothetical protein